jgi:hypothetical protein
MKLPPQRSRRAVNAASTGYDIDYINDGYDDYDMGNYYNDNASDDFDAFTLEVHNMETKRPHIPSDVWKLLPTEAQDILRNKPLMKSKQRPFGNFNKSRSSRPSSRQVRMHLLHDDDNNDNDVNVHYETTDEYDSAPEDPGPSTTNSNVETLVNKTEQSGVKFHPGDVRHVVGGSNNSNRRSNINSNSNHTQHNNNQTSPPPSILKPSVNPKDVIIVKGKKYYGAHSTIVTYSLHKRSLIPTAGSLVDRGANGGIAERRDHVGAISSLVRCYRH